MIKGTTRLIGHLGYPTESFKAPMIYNPYFERYDIDAVVVPMGCKPEDYAAFLKLVFKLSNIHGALVTMPHKVTTIPLLDEVMTTAKVAGACNAIRLGPNGTLVGDMFDGVGLLGAVRSLGIELPGLRVGLIGAGGAGSAIGFALAESGVASLRILDADRERAEGLARRVSEADAQVASSSGPFAPGDVDLLINATPVGMAPDDGAPIDVGALTAATSVVDIVTKPTPPLLAAAVAAGCRHVGGAAMVAAQTEAILAFLFFADRRP